MELNSVIAIIRNEKLKQVEACLQEFGIEGISLSQVMGYGQYKNFYAKDMMSTHTRLEMITSARKVKGIVQIVMDAAGTCEPDDGIITVLPVIHCYRIHTKAELKIDCTGKKKL